MGLRVLNAAAGFPILLLMSRSVLPSLLTTLPKYVNCSTPSAWFVHLTPQLDAILVHLICSHSPGFWRIPVNMEKGLVKEPLWTTWQVDGS